MRNWVSETDVGQEKKKPPGNWHISPLETSCKRDFGLSKVWVHLLSGEDVDSNALAFIGKYVGYESEEYQLSRYYITGAICLSFNVCVDGVEQQTEEFHLATFMSAVAGQGDNPLLMDLSNASQQLALANQSITSYGSEVRFLYFMSLSEARFPTFEILGPTKTMVCFIYIYTWCVFPFTVVAIGVACEHGGTFNQWPAPGRGLVFLERSWRVEEGNCTGAGCTGVRRLVCNVMGARDCQMSRAKGWRADDPRQFAPLTAERVSLLRPCCETGVTGFTFSLCYFCFWNVFELLGLKGLNKNGARIFARRPWLAFSGWSFSRSSWDSCCCPCWSVWGSTGKGWCDLLPGWQPWIKVGSGYLEARRGWYQTQQEARWVLEDFTSMHLLVKTAVPQMSGKLIQHTEHLHWQAVELRGERARYGGPAPQLWAWCWTRQTRERCSAHVNKSLTKAQLAQLLNTWTAFASSPCSSFFALMAL